MEGQIHALLLILLPTCLYIHCWALLASTPQFGGTWIRIDGPIKSVRAGNLRGRGSLRNSCEAARQRERERERERESERERERKRGWMPMAWDLCRDRAYRRPWDLRHKLPDG